MSTGYEVYLINHTDNNDNRHISGFERWKMVYYLNKYSNNIGAAVHVIEIRCKKHKQEDLCDRIRHHLKYVENWDDNQFDLKKTESKVINELVVLKL